MLKQLMRWWFIFLAGFWFCSCSVQDQVPVNSVPASSSSNRDSVSPAAERRTVEVRESAGAARAVHAQDFAPGQLEVHYRKHGYQFGNITEEQYLRQAQALLDAPAGGDVLEKTRANGDVLHYRASTGEFAVMTARGRIRTYFKTDMRYWSRQ